MAPLKLGTQPDDPLLTSVFKQVDCCFACLLCYPTDALHVYNAVLPMCFLLSGCMISWCLASRLVHCKARSQPQQQLHVVFNDITADDAHSLCLAVI